MKWWAEPVVQFGWGQRTGCANEALCSICSLSPCRGDECVNTRQVVSPGVLQHQTKEMTCHSFSLLSSTVLSAQCHQREDIDRPFYHSPQRFSVRAMQLQNKQVKQRPCGVQCSDSV